MTEWMPTRLRTACAFPGDAEAAAAAVRARAGRPDAAVLVVITGVPEPVCET